MTIEKWFRSCRPTFSCRKGFFPLVITGIMVVLLFNSFESLAQGNLLITPRRLVFSGNTRSLDLNLANTGRDTATYAISVIQIRMTEDGGFQQITEPDPGQQFADRFIRFFPRSVTLGPGESQAVKIQVIRYNELKPGEYRSHFYFRAEAKAAPLGEEDNTPKDTTVFSVKITPIFGIVIPVIIQYGTSDTRTILTDLNLSHANDTVKQLSFVFKRTGNMSVYGNIAVDHVSPQGKVTRVGIANGVGVYTPNSTRKFSINLNEPSGTDLTSGKLRVTFSAPSDLKSEKYAEAELVLR